MSLINIALFFFTDTFWVSYVVDSDLSRMSLSQQNNISRIDDLRSRIEKLESSLFFLIWAKMSLFVWWNNSKNNEDGCRFAFFVISSERPGDHEDVSFDSGLPFLRG